MPRTDPIFRPTAVQLLEEIQKLKKRIGVLETSEGVFEINNEHTPATLTTDVDDYVPGNYDVLRLNASADVSITGITSGVKGRFLEIVNISTFKITLPYESLSSAAVNRIINTGGEDIVLFPTARLRLYYDSTLTRWQVPDPPSWLGIYGVTMYVRNSSPQSIANNSDDLLTFDTIITDEWALWDAGNNRINIVETGIYMGVVAGNFTGNATGYRAVKWKYGGLFIVSDSKPTVTTAAVQTAFSVPLFFPFLAGDTIECFAAQNSGGALDFNNQMLAFTRIR